MTPKLVPGDVVINHVIREAAGIRLEGEILEVVENPGHPKAGPWYRVDFQDYRLKEMGFALDKPFHEDVLTLVKEAMPKDKA